MTMIDDHAICVRTWDWSETSQTAVLLTKDHGMIRVLAKGSKRDRSSFSGGLELCTTGYLTTILRPNSDLALLTQWDLIEPMIGIRKSYRSYLVAMLGIDLVPRLIQDHDPHPDIHDALLTLLQDCNQQDPLAGDELDIRVFGMLSWYLWKVLVAIGAMPIVDHDVLTGGQLHPAKVYGFSAQLGGVTQDPSAKNTGHGADEIDLGHRADHGVWRVRAQTIELMNKLGESPSPSMFLDVASDQVWRLARLLGTYVRERTGTEIPAMDWLLNSYRE